MKHSLLRTVFVFQILIMLAVSPAAAGEYMITIKNLTNGIYFTPFLITAHDDATHLFQTGHAATEELRAMAEGGDITGLSALVGGADADTVENPAGGMTAPGQIIDNIVIDTDDTGATHLSLVAMLLPTNDGFVGLDGMMLPSEPGVHTYMLNGYDAGTEANDELITGGGAPGVPGIPAAPANDAGANGTGVASVDANTMVHVHRGNLGDANLAGGMSDLDSSVHRWLNPVAEIIIEMH